MEKKKKSKGGRTEIGKKSTGFSGQTLERDCKGENKEKSGRMIKEGNDSGGKGGYGVAVRFDDCCEDGMG